MQNAVKSIYIRSVVYIDAVYIMYEDGLVLNFNLFFILYCFHVIVLCI